MTSRTRYFVIASLLVLGVGLGAGLVAYFVGLPTGAFATQGPDELQLIPRSASLVAYADVHEIMLSDVRQKVLPLLQGHANGREEFQTRTGINIETDLDHVVVGVVPGREDQTPPVGAIVLARGRFEDAKIEALMTEHGAQVETYKGRRILVAPAGPRGASLSVGFIEAGLVAVGGTPLVRTAIDLKDGGESVMTNDDIMNRVRSLEDGNAWAVGRFETLTRGRLPGAIASQLPPVSWFSASSRIDAGIRGELRADANDDESAENLRQVVRGFIALAKLQAGSRPELREVVDSLNLGGTGRTVALSFTVPSNAIETLGAALPKRRPAVPPQ